MLPELEKKKAAESNTHNSHFLICQTHPPTSPLAKQMRELKTKYQDSLLDNKRLQDRIDSLEFYSKTNTNSAAFHNLNAATATTTTTASASSRARTPAPLSRHRIHSSTSLTNNNNNNARDG